MFRFTKVWNIFNFSRFDFNDYTKDTLASRGDTVRLSVTVTDGGAVDENDDWKVREPKVEGGGGM